MIEYAATQIAIVVVVIVARKKCAITCSLLNIRKVCLVLISSLYMKPFFYSYFKFVCLFVLLFLCILKVFMLTRASSELKITLPTPLQFILT